MRIKIGSLYQTPKGFKGVLGGVPVLAQIQENTLVILLDALRIKEVSAKPFISYPFFSFIPSKGIYKDKLRIDILDIKLNGNLKKIPSLVEKLVSTYKENPLLSKIDMVIPCPHSTDKKIKLTNLLCLGLGEKIQKPVFLNILQRTKNLEFPQVGLSSIERLKNVKGAFTTTQTVDIQDKICLLVDDIITTGATANECANSLFLAGAKKIYLITLAQSFKKHLW